MTDKTYSEQEVKQLLTDQRLEILEGGIATIQQKLDTHMADSRAGMGELKSFISERIHEQDKRSMECEQNIRDEFYKHIGEKYATMVYVDGQIKYVKIAAVLAALSALSTIIGITWLFINISGGA